MNQEDIIAFYETEEPQDNWNYDIMAEERVSLFSQFRTTKQKQEKKTTMLSTQPIIYCLLGICCFILALSSLPEEDRLYFFYDDPMSKNIGLIACMSALCIFGVTISYIIQKAFTNKECNSIPFLTKKQHKLNFNPTICLAGQVAHLLLLIEIILQTMPSLQHETLMDLSFLLNMVYFTYASSFLERQKAKQMHYVPYVCYILVTLTCIHKQDIRVLCQHFIDSMKLHYTHIWKMQTERMILMYLAIMLQGIQFQLFRPAIQELEKRSAIITEVL